MTFADLYSKAQPLDPDLAEEVPMFDLEATAPEAAPQESPSEPDRSD